MKMTISQYFKVIITFTALLLSAHTNAVTTVYGLTLNSTNEIDFTKKFPNAKHDGISKYSEGNIYLIPAKDLNQPDLIEVSVIFDDDNILACITLTYPGPKYWDLKPELDLRYSLFKELIPRVRSGYSIYKNDDIYINLSQEYLGKTYLSYMTTKFSRQMY